MTVSGIWAGATSPAGFTVVAKTAAGSARLAVSTSPTMSSPTYFGPVTPSLGIAKVAATGRAADTTYYYALEEAGVLDTANVGTVHTFPVVDSPASYRVAVSSCAGTSSSSYLTEVGISNSPAFDHIKASAPLLFCHIGDLHYKNIAVNDPALFRQAFDAIWAASHQAGLYKSCSLAYMWDDHDTGGNDTAGTTSPSRPAASQVYRERVPSYTVPAGPDAPIYQSWQIGRVLFIMSDTRHDRSADSMADGPTKTMLGSAQKAWMDSLLGSTTAEALVWLNPTPWMGLAQDTWAGFPTERQEIVDMLDAHGWLGRMVIVNGDNHSNAMDTGGGNTWGHCPVWMFGSIDSPSTGVSSQYDMGPSSPGVDRYGTIDVADDGATLTLTGTGWIGTGLWRSYSLSINTVTATTPPTSLALTYDDTISRVRITAHGLALGTTTVDVDRSTNQISWASVRGGMAHPVDSSETTPVVLNVNPYFETDAAGWVMSGGDTIVRSTAQHHEGVAAGLLTSDGSGASVTCSADQPTAPAAVVGVTYTAAGWVRSPVAWAAGAWVALVWIDASDAVLSLTTGTTTALTANTWTQLTVTGPAPAGAVKVGLRVALLGTPAAAQQLYVDELAVTVPVTDNSVGLDDYEFTPDVANYYRVRQYDSDGDLLDTAQAATTPGMDAVWLKSASRPFLNTAVPVVDMGPVSRDTRSGTFQIAGRSLPVAVSDRMTSRSFDLQVLTDTAAKASTLDALLSLGEPLLVHVPQACPLPIPTIYATVGNAAADRPARLTDLGVTTLPLTEVAAPGPDVVGVTITWAGVTNAYTTWADLQDAQATWADVLDSIGTPADVVVS